MKPIKKQIVTDESMHPVAVLIDCEDWQAIEKFWRIIINKMYSQRWTLADYSVVIQFTISP